MIYRSKKNLFSASTHRRAFSLIEVMTALVILALVSSSVLVVISRCMASATDSTLRMHAFEAVRENVEKLLASEQVTLMTEYGISDKYPQIQWQTSVETFSEPATSQMWLRVISSAVYIDSAGQEQTIEITHWLTKLTEQQVQMILQEQEKQKQQLAEQIIETREQAAEYAGVDEDTLRQWVDNGMPKTRDGFFIKSWLDLYRENDGNPGIEDKNQLAQDTAGLIGGSTDRQSPSNPDIQEPGDENYDIPDDIDPDLKNSLEELLNP